MVLVTSGKAGSQVTANGNSPLTIQESDSNSETTALRATNSSGNGSQPGIVMKTAAGGHIGGIYRDVNSDYMRLSTSGTDRVIITNTGNIGIKAKQLQILQTSISTYLTSANPNTEDLIHLRTDPGGSYVTRGRYVKIGRDGTYDNSAVHYDIVGSAGPAGSMLLRFNEWNSYKN